MAARGSRLATLALRGVLIGALSLLLLLTISPYVGKLHPLLDFLTGFRVQALFLGLILCLATGVTRWHRAFLLPVAAALMALVAFDVLSIALPDKRPGAEGAKSRIRLLSFNVLHGNDRSVDVLDFVASENPDFVVFFEADRHWPTELAPLRQSYPYHLPLGGLHVLVFSKYPLTIRAFRPVGVNRGDLILTVSHPGGPLTLVPSHAYPQLHFGEPGYQHRNTQLVEKIGTGLADVHRPLVVIGDLNVTPWSPYFREMIDASGLYDARRGSWPSPTQAKYSPSWLFGIPIDHCLVSKEVRVDRFRTGPHLGSDHRPLIVDIAF